MGWGSCWATAAALPPICPTQAALPLTHCLLWRAGSQRLVCSIPVTSKHMAGTGFPSTNEHVAVSIYLINLTQTCLSCARKEGEGVKQII